MTNKRRMAGHLLLVTLCPSPLRVRRPAHQTCFVLESPPAKEQPLPQTVVTTPSRRARLVWGVVTALTVGLGYLLILLHNRQFFLQDDSEAGAVPDWLYIGDRLHRGGLPILTPDAWMGGNWTGFHKPFCPSAVPFPPIQASG